MFLVIWHFNLLSHSSIGQKSSGLGHGSHEVRIKVFVSLGSRGEGISRLMQAELSWEGSAPHGSRTKSCFLVSFLARVVLSS